MKIPRKISLDDGFNLETLMETLFYRDEFLSIASHELKTPLTSLKLHAQVFRRNTERVNDAYSKENVDRLIDQIDNQANRLIKIINNMLDISRIRSGQLIMTKNHFSLSNLLHEVILKFNQNEIASEIDPHISIFGDRERIEQVLVKLLNNAVRYGGGHSIEVKLRQGKAHISLTVKDKGQGISAEDQKRIFHRFQRAIPASEISGMGLGLYIAREIVEAHYGKITVKSNTVVGSVFNVKFKTEESK